tara:strand:- start:4452 stop:4745 length:294 start_codon:yes stop_codon:yes gene_type:complete
MSNDIFTSEEVIEYVHIRIQQRNSRQKITTVEGLPDKYDLKRILKVCKREFACNGNIVNDRRYGEVLQLQGDQRDNMSKFLSVVQLVPDSHVKIHGV